MAETVIPLRPHGTLVMGVVNVTPDSFSDGGLFQRPEDAAALARRLAEEGADLIDIGGESTRPGSDPVSEQEELDRVAPVVERAVRETGVPVSIDTSKPAVARECLRLGARIVNDITALSDPAMAAAVKGANAAMILMHMRGKPKTMQKDVHYDDAVGEIREFLAERERRAAQAGIAEIVLDPGIGFGKTAAHNFEILRRFGEFLELGRPLLAGPSRKSFLGSLASRLPADKRLEGTIAACCAAALAGAAIVRVHDVRPVKRALEVIEAIRGAIPSGGEDARHSI